MLLSCRKPEIFLQTTLLQGVCKKLHIIFISFGILKCLIVYFLNLLNKHIIYITHFHLRFQFLGTAFFWEKTPPSGYFSLYMPEGNTQKNSSNFLKKATSIKKITYKLITNYYFLRCQVAMSLHHSCLESSM